MVRQAKHQGLTESPSLSTFPRPILAGSLYYHDGQNPVRQGWNMDGKAETDKTRRFHAEHAHKGGSSVLRAFEGDPLRIRDTHDGSVRRSDSQEPFVQFLGTNCS